MLIPTGLFSGHFASHTHNHGHGEINKFFQRLGFSCVGPQRGSSVTNRQYYTHRRRRVFLYWVLGWSWMGEGEGRRNTTSQGTSTIGNNAGTYLWDACRGAIYNHQQEYLIYPLYRFVICPSTRKNNKCTNNLLIKHILVNRLQLVPPLLRILW